MSAYFELDSERPFQESSKFSLARKMPLRSDMQGIGARFVYILRSDSDPLRHYVGRTTDVDRRLEWHNAGPCGYTLQHRPWSIVVSLEFPEERAAARFEKYLKSGSGRAFATRHFGQVE